MHFFSTKREHHERRITTMLTSHKRKFLTLSIQRSHFILMCLRMLILMLIVPRLFEEKRRDIVFGFPSFCPCVCPSVRPSVLPSFHPSVLPSPYRVCTLCAQLLLQFYSDSFETLQMFLPSFEDMHVVWI